MKSPEKLRAFRNAAHQCAMQMMENALYIQKELPSVDIPDEIRVKAQTVCGSLVGTKHDIISELFELDEKTGTASAPSDLNPTIELIVEWLAETTSEMCAVVDAVRDASDRDDRFSPGFLLLSESATNVLNPFNAAVAAARAMKQETGTD